jgi:hypothetical protein
MVAGELGGEVGSGLYSRQAAITIPETNTKPIARLKRRIVNKVAYIRRQTSLETNRSGSVGMT